MTEVSSMLPNWGKWCKKLYYKIWTTDSMKKPIEVMLFLNKYRKECKIHMESQNHVISKQS